MEEWILLLKRIGIFMILAEVILHFIPTAQYEKYIRLILDCMLVYFLVLPLVQWYQGEESYLQEPEWDIWSEDNGYINEEFAEQMEIENSEALKTIIEGYESAQTGTQIPVSQNCVSAGQVAE